MFVYYNGVCGSPTRSGSAGLGFQKGNLRSRLQRFHSRSRLPTRALAPVSPDVMPRTIGDCGARDVFVHLREGCSAAFQAVRFVEADYILSLASDRWSAILPCRWLQTVQSPQNCVSRNLGLSGLLI